MERLDILCARCLGKGEHGVGGVVVEADERAGGRLVGERKMGVWRGDVEIAHERLCQTPGVVATVAREVGLGGGGGLEKVTVSEKMRGKEVEDLAKGDTLSGGVFEGKVGIDEFEGGKPCGDGSGDVGVLWGKGVVGGHGVGDDHIEGECGELEQLWAVCGLVSGVRGIGIGSDGQLNC